MRPDHDELEDLVAAFALGACDAEDAAIVRGHLETCTACRELVGRLSRVVSALPLASQEVRPPDRLRGRILAEAAASPQATSRRAAAAPTRSLGPRRRARGGWLPRLRLPGYRLAIAALALGLIALAGWNGYLYRSLNQPPAHYSMAGAGSMAGSQASVTSYGREDLTLVSFRGLPPPAAGRVYELWLIGADGRPAPAAVFTPDAAGDHQLVVNRSLEGVQVVAVTEEPGPSGSSEPTQQPQLSGRTV